MLLPTPDPLTRPAFGGDEVEMEAIQGFKKALKDLRAKHSGKEEVSSEEEGEENVDADEEFIARRLSVHNPFDEDWNEVDQVDNDDDDEGKSPSTS